jgi:hypothetical protein
MFPDDKNKVKVEKKEEPIVSVKNEKKEVDCFEDPWDNFSGTHFI